MLKKTLKINCTFADSKFFEDSKEYNNTNSDEYEKIYTAQRS